MMQDPQILEIRYPLTRCLTQRIVYVSRGSIGDLDRTELSYIMWIVMVIKREVLSSSLVKEIQRRISTHEFSPGDKLPPQDELASMFGVSRTALREALKQLALMGLVELKHGKGTFISSSTPSELLESLSPLLLMNKETTFELLEARLFIESALASLAAKKASPEDIGELGTMVQGMKKDLGEGDIEAFTEKDLGFHLLIANASKNRVLGRILQTIRDMLHQFIGEALVLIPGMARSALNYHGRILEAIEKHDAESAEKHMRNHILHIETSIRKYHKLKNNPE